MLTATATVLKKMLITLGTFTLFTVLLISYSKMKMTPEELSMSRFQLDEGEGSVQKRNPYKPLNSITNKTLYRPGEILPPSVVLRTKGGLGNQLFEYACSYAIARKNNWPLYIYLESSYSGENASATRKFTVYDRDFSLDFFNVPLSSWNIFDENAKVSPRIQYLNDSEILEGKYAKDLVIQQANSDYCQSEIFFEPYKEELKEIFKLKEDRLQNAKVQEWEEVINLSAESVFVHIRRGDFVNLNVSLGMNFYRDGMTNLSNLLKTSGRSTPSFFIFSDDMDTVKRELFPSEDHHFLKRFPIHYVSDPGQLISIQEFMLMTKCRHGVLPGSSFSWWAAYLIPNPDKIIIAARYNLEFFRKAYEGNSFLIWQYKHLYYPYLWLTFDYFN